MLFFTNLRTLTSLRTRLHQDGEATMISLPGTDHSFDTLLLQFPRGEFRGLQLPPVTLALQFSFNRYSPGESR